MQGIRVLIAAGTLVAMLASDTTGQRREGNLKVGDAAPDFAVKDANGKKTVKLSELRGKPVVLIFGSCT